MKLIDIQKWLITFTLFLFTSISYCQMISDSSYFPLAISNEWNYSATIKSPYTKSVTDTVRIHGLLYYNLSYEYFRESGNKIYLLKRDSTEVLLYNFDAKVGDSWNIQIENSCDYGSMVIMQGKKDTVTTPAGVFTNCIHFKYKKICVDAGLYDSWFVKGIGEVKFKTDNIAGIIEYNLANYKLNTPTDVAIEQKENVTYRLFQNYPNPFNPSTKINYTVPKSGFVTIKVYDLLGREVTTLVNENKPVGNYNVEFNAGKLVSGVYFYRMNAGDFVQTKKLILLK